MNLQRTQDAGSRKPALRNMMLNLLLPLGLTAGTAMASEASTSALTGSDAFGNRRAEASAQYDGDFGFANTRTTTGHVSTARGVALGVDEDGLSLSVSNAVSVGNQSAANNLNLSIGTNGGVAISGGRSNASGPLQHSAAAGGGSSIQHGIPSAHAITDASSDPFGTASGKSFTKTTRGIRNGYSARHSGPRGLRASPRRSSGSRYPIGQQRRPRVVRSHRIR